MKVLQISEEVEWKVASFEYTNENGEIVNKKIAYNGISKIGDITTITYYGNDYDAIIECEENPPPEINKHVKVKISDTVESTAVYGVFVFYDIDNSDENIEGYWNDISVGSVGNYVIRISSDETVNIGDLLESNGDGCARVQSDDIVRSKTIGKVTSTKVQKVYDDGSYLVPCVLYCG
jgi:hypothetical protein